VREEGFDVLIAAPAVVLRCTLVTKKTRHFSKVHGQRAALPNQSK
jgi:predicted nucleic acid-binding protein